MIHEVRQLPVTSWFLSSSLLKGGKEVQINPLWPVEVGDGGAHTCDAFSTNLHVGAMALAKLPFQGAQLYKDT